MTLSDLHLSISWAAQGPGLRMTSTQGSFLPENLPESLGHVESFYDAGQDAPFVFIVQDAHAVVDAQRHIQELILYLEKTAGVRLVGVEGAEGILDPVLFRSFPDSFIKHKVFESYLQAGELTGAELAALDPEGQSRIFGIEDWSLYEDNHRAYLRTAEKKVSADSALENLHTILRQKRKDVFNPGLLAFHSLREDFYSEKSGLPELLKGLGQNAFEGPEGALLKQQAPHVLALLEAVHHDESASVERDLRAMAEGFIAKAVPLFNREESVLFYEQHQAFLTGTMAPGEFLLVMARAGERYGFKPKLTPAMRRVLLLTEKLNAIRGTGLFTELERVLDHLEKKRMQTPIEAELLEDFKRLHRLRRLARLEMTRDEFDLFYGSAEDHLKMLGEGREAFSASLDFYRIALERDRAFQKKIEEGMRREAVERALVVSGGFHSAGLQEEFRKAGYSYAVISPAILSLDGEEFYEPLMKGDFSYKEMLETTYYDAFARHAGARLVREVKEPDFKLNLKLWRDEVIRTLAAEGRIGEVADYTRYIDRLFSVYQEKFPNRKSPRLSPGDLRKALEEELRIFERQTVQKWQSDFRGSLGKLSKVLGRMERSGPLDAAAAGTIFDNPVSRADALSSPRAMTNSFVFGWQRPGASKPFFSGSIEAAKIPFSPGQVLADALAALAMETDASRSSAVKAAARDSALAIENVARQADLAAGLSPEAPIVRDVNLAREGLRAALEGLPGSPAEIAREILRQGGGQLDADTGRSELRAGMAESLELLSRRITELEARVAEKGIHQLPRFALHGEASGRTPDGDFYYFVFDPNLQEYWKPEYYLNKSGEVDSWLSYETKGKIRRGEIAYSEVLMSPREFFQRLFGTVAFTASYGGNNPASGQASEIYLMKETPRRTLPDIGNDKQGATVRYYDPDSKTITDFPIFSVEGYFPSSEIDPDSVLATPGLNAAEIEDVVKWGAALTLPDDRAGQSLIAQSYASRILYAKILEALAGLETQSSSRRSELRGYEVKDSFQQELNFQLQQLQWVWYGAGEDGQAHEDNIFRQIQEAQREFFPELNDKFNPAAVQAYNSRIYRILDQSYNNPKARAVLDRIMNLSGVDYRIFFFHGAIFDAFKVSMAGKGIRNESLEYAEDMPSTPGFYRYDTYNLEDFHQVFVELVQNNQRHMKPNNMILAVKREAGEKLELIYYYGNLNTDDAARIEESLYGGEYSNDNGGDRSHAFFNTVAPAVFRLGGTIQVEFNGKAWEFYPRNWATWRWLRALPGLWMRAWYTLGTWFFRSGAGRRDLGASSLERGRGVKITLSLPRSKIKRLDLQPGAPVHVEYTSLNLPGSLNDVMLHSAYDEEAGAVRFNVTFEEMRESRLTTMTLGFALNGQLDEAEALHRQVVELIEKHPLDFFSALSRLDPQARLQPGRSYDLTRVELDADLIRHFLGKFVPSENPDRFAVRQEGGNFFVDFPDASPAVTAGVRNLSAHIRQTFAFYTSAVTENTGPAQGISLGIFLNEQAVQDADLSSRSELRAEEDPAPSAVFKYSGATENLWQTIVKALGLEKLTTGGTTKVYTTSRYPRFLLKKKEVPETEVFRIEAPWNTPEEYFEISSLLAGLGLAVEERPIVVASGDDSQSNPAKTNMSWQMKINPVAKVWDRKPSKRAALERAAFGHLKKVWTAGFFDADFKMHNLGLYSRDGGEAAGLIDFDFVYRLPESNDPEAIYQWLRNRDFKNNGRLHFSPGEHFLLNFFYFELTGDPEDQAQRAEVERLARIRSALFPGVDSELVRGTISGFYAAARKAYAELKLSRDEKKNPPIAKVRQVKNVMIEAMASDSVVEQTLRELALSISKVRQRAADSSLAPVAAAPPALPEIIPPAGKLVPEDAFVVRNETGQVADVSKILNPEVLDRLASGIAKIYPLRFPAKSEYNEKLSTAEGWLEKFKTHTVLVHFSSEGELNGFLLARLPEKPNDAMGAVLDRVGTLQDSVKGKGQNLMRVFFQMIRERGTHRAYWRMPDFWPQQDLQFYRAFLDEQKNAGAVSNYFVDETAAFVFFNTAPPQEDSASGERSELRSLIEDFAQSYGAEEAAALEKRTGELIGFYRGAAMAPEASELFFYPGIFSALLGVRPGFLAYEGKDPYPMPLIDELKKYPDFPVGYFWQRDPGVLVDAHALALRLMKEGEFLFENGIFDESDRPLLDDLLRALKSGNASAEKTALKKLLQLLMLEIFRSDGYVPVRENHQDAIFGFILGYPLASIKGVMKWRRSLVDEGSEPIDIVSPETRYPEIGIATEISSESVEATLSYHQRLEDALDYAYERFAAEVPGFKKMEEALALPSRSARSELRAAGDEGDLPDPAAPEELGLPPQEWPKRLKQIRLFWQGAEAAKFGEMKALIAKYRNVRGMRLMVSRLASSYLTGSVASFNEVAGELFIVDRLIDHLRPDYDVEVLGLGLNAGYREIDAFLKIVPRPGAEPEAPLLEAGFYTLEAKEDPASNFGPLISHTIRHQVAYQIRNASFFADAGLPYRGAIVGVGGENSVKTPLRGLREEERPEDSTVPVYSFVTDAFSIENSPSPQNVPVPTEEDLNIWYHQAFNVESIFYKVLLPAFGLPVVVDGEEGKRRSAALRVLENRERGQRDAARRNIHRAKKDKEIRARELERRAREVEGWEEFFEGIEAADPEGSPAAIRAALRWYFGRLQISVDLLRLGLQAAAVDPSSETLESHDVPIREADAANAIQETYHLELPEHKTDRSRAWYWLKEQYAAAKDAAAQAQADKKAALAQSPAKNSGQPRTPNVRAASEAKGFTEVFAGHPDMLPDLKLEDAGYAENVLWAFFAGNLDRGVSVPESRRQIQDSIAQRGRRSAWAEIVRQAEINYNGPVDRSELRQQNPFTAEGYDPAKAFIGSLYWGVPVQLTELTETDYSFEERKNREKVLRFELKAPEAGFRTSVRIERNATEVTALRSPGIPRISAVGMSERERTILTWDLILGVMEWLSSQGHETVRFYLIPGGPGVPLFIGTSESPGMIRAGNPFWKSTDAGESRYFVERRPGFSLEGLEGVQEGDTLVFNLAGAAQEIAAFRAALGKQLGELLAQRAAGMWRGTSKNQVLAAVSRIEQAYGRSELRVYGREEPEEVTVEDLQNLRRWLRDFDAARIVRDTVPGGVDSAVSKIWGPEGEAEILKAGDSLREVLDREVMTSLTGSELFPGQKFDSLFSTGPLSDWGAELNLSLLRDRLSSRVSALAEGRPANQAAEGFKVSDEQLEAAGFLLDPSRNDLLVNLLSRHFGREIRLPERKKLFMDLSFFEGTPMTAARKFVEEKVQSGGLALAFLKSTETREGLADIFRIPGVLRRAYTLDEPLSIKGKETADSTHIFISGTPLEAQALGLEASGVMVSKADYYSSRLGAPEFASLVELVLSVESLRKQLPDQAGALFPELPANVIQAVFGLLDELMSMEEARRAFASAA